MRISHCRAPASVHARRDLCFDRQHLGWPLCPPVLRCIWGGKRPTNLYKGKPWLSEDHFSKINRGNYRRLFTISGPTEPLHRDGTRLKTQPAAVTLRSSQAIPAEKAPRELFCSERFKFGR